MVQTYVAAEKLEKTGKRLGYRVSVETHGSQGIQKPFAPAEIDAADYIIIAADTAISNHIRFGNKQILVISLADAIQNTESVFQSLKEKALPYEEAKAAHKKIFE